MRLSLTRSLDRNSPKQSESPIKGHHSLLGRRKQEFGKALKKQSETKCSKTPHDPTLALVHASKIIEETWTIMDRGGSAQQSWFRNQPGEAISRSVSAGTTSMCQKAGLHRAISSRHLQHVLVRRSRLGWTFSIFCCMSAIVFA